jgi:hypothetical protein
MMTMMLLLLLLLLLLLMMSLFGQLGLWAPCPGVESYSHQSRMFSHTPVIGESGHSLS